MTSLIIHKVMKEAEQTVLTLFSNVDNFDIKILNGLTKQSKSLTGSIV